MLVNALVAAAYHHCTQRDGGGVVAWHKKWNTIMVAIAKSWHQIAPLLSKIIGPVFLLDKVGWNGAHGATLRRRRRHKGEMVCVKTKSI